MPSEIFISNLSHAAHLACIICWFKETSNDVSIGDKGIIHELLHLICGTYSIEDCDRQLEVIREQFKEVLMLV